MMAAIILISAWMSAALGAALIALTDPRHWKAVTGSSTCLRQPRWSRAYGGLLLLFAVVLAVIRDGWGIGLLLGPLLIATAIATIIALIAVRPRSLRIFQGLVSVDSADRRP